MYAMEGNWVRVNHPGYHERPGYATDFFHAGYDDDRVFEARRGRPYYATERLSSVTERPSPAPSPRRVLVPRPPPVLAAEPGHYQPASYSFGTSFVPVQRVVEVPVGFIRRYEYVDDRPPVQVHPPSPRAVTFIEVPDPEPLPPAPVLPQKRRRRPFVVRHADCDSGCVHCGRRWGEDPTPRTHEQRTTRSPTCGCGPPKAAWNSSTTPRPYTAPLPSPRSRRSHISPYIDNLHGAGHERDWVTY